MTKRSKKQEAAVVEHQDVVTLTSEDIVSIESIATPAELESTTIEAPVLEASSEESQAPDTSEEPTETFMSMVERLKSDAETIDVTKKAIISTIEDRKAFEAAKSSANGSIQATLNKGREKLITGENVAVLLAAAVTPDFVMRSTNEGSAYNVYAILKLADLTKALVSGVISNDVNRHIVKSLFQVISAGEQFTTEVARACVSKQIRLTDKVAKCLSRHTASPATAPTQASSTMQALSTLGIVKNTGTTRNPVYQLTDAPIVERMKEVALAA